VAIPKSVFLVVTILTLALFASIYPITIPWKPVFASLDALTLRPNDAGTYQTWGTFGAPPSHWEGTSDQNDATGVQSPAGDTTAKETEQLQNASQTGTINSVTAYMRAKASGSSAPERATLIWKLAATEVEPGNVAISRTTFTDYSDTRTTNPAGGSWDWSDINSLEIGARATILGSSEYIQVSEFWIVVDYTPGFNLNLHVMDWDLADAIANAHVTMNNGTDYVQVSDNNGWANYTGLSGTVTAKVQYFGFWVNGTFSVTMDFDKTINIQCKLYDVTVLVQESVQNAYLASANVTVYNSTSVQGNKITSGVTGNNGQVQLLNLPNNTLTFTQYGGASYSLVIGNTTQLVSSENQTITLTANQNSINTNNSYSIIAFAGMTIPLKGGLVMRRLKKKRRNKSRARQYWQLHFLSSAYRSFKGRTYQHETPRVYKLQEK